MTCRGGVTAAAIRAGATEPEERLARLATPIELEFKGGARGFGSGFFYQELGPRDPEGPDHQWRTITGIYVVTNRHVVLPDLPQPGGKTAQATPGDVESLTFYLTSVEGGKIGWLPVKVSKKQLSELLFFHPDETVDVAVVWADKLVTEVFKTKPNAAEQWSAVNREQLPENSRLDIDAGDEVIVIGYPRQYHDPANKLPIMKLGLLSTPWGTRYRGNDTFLLDLRNFQGASGSVVISQPTNFFVDQGRPMVSKTKQYLFLGIYSGEPHMGYPKDVVDLGVGSHEVGHRAALSRWIGGIIPSERWGRW